MWTCKSPKYRFRWGLGVNLFSALNRSVRVLSEMGLGTGSKMGPSGNKLIKMMPPTKRTSIRVEMIMVRLLDFVIGVNNWLIEICVYGL